MKYKYNFLKYSENSPVNIHLFNSNNIDFEWHKDIEIILVGRGSATLQVKNDTFNLQKESIILINSSEVHKLYNLSEDCLIIGLYFDPYFFEKYYKDFSKLQFRCNSLLETDIDKVHYNKLIKLFSSIALSILYNDELNNINILKNMFHLTGYLIEHFNFYIDLNGSDLSSYHQRFNRILEYINNNYTEKITLSDLSRREYLTTHYISRFFNKYMGVGFIKYLNSFRLDKSMNDLTNTNKTLLDIALDHGFPSLKSYRTTFYEKYNMSPSAYRKSYIDINKDSEVENNYNFPKSNISEYIYFLQKYQSNNTQVEYIAKDIDGVNFSKKSWINFEKILYFHKASSALNYTWQSNLLKTLEIIKIDFLKFSGIFDEDMYHHDKNKNVYIWYNLENIFDFLSKNHINPFLKLEYSNKSENLKDFFNKLENFISFCVDRYGIEYVKQWKFELSSIEKDYPSMLKFYNNILDNISSSTLLSKLNFGIDFTIGSTFHREHFLKYIKDKKINFISIYVNEKVFLETKEFVKLLLVKTKRLMKIKTYFIQKTENHYLNDTCYMATKMVDSFVDDYFLYNSQVDFIDSLKNMKIFKGEKGILTYNGLKKPTFNAFFLLGKLNGYIVDSGSGYILTKNQDSYKLLLFNHKNINNHINTLEENYDHLYKDILLKTKYMDLKIKLDDGKYTLKHYTLNKKNGSIYDEWLKMGKPIISGGEVVRFLKSKESLGLKFEDEIIENEINIKEHIMIDGLKLIEINRV